VATARKYLKSASLKPDGGHLVAKARTCSKSAFWKLTGAMFWPRQENTQNQSSGSLLVPFGGQGTEMLKTSFLEASWQRLMAKPRNSSKAVFWGSPGTILCTKHANAQNQPSLHFLEAIGGEDTKMFKTNQPSGDLLGPFYGQGKKILKIDLLKLPWTIWWPRHDNYLNQPLDPESR